MFEIDKWYQCVLRSYSKPKIQTSIQQPNYDFKGLCLDLLNFEYSVNVILYLILPYTKFCRPCVHSKILPVTLVYMPCNWA